MFSPGTAAGGFTIQGSLNLLADARMSFDLGGRQQGRHFYDYIRVTNFVSFVGTLSLSLGNNFRPTAADTFTLMEFGSGSGLFGNILNGDRLPDARRLRFVPGQLHHEQFAGKRFSECPAHHLTQPECLRLHGPAVCLRDQPELRD